MKHLKKNSLITFIFTAVLLTFFAGCGGDDSPTSSSSGGWPPTINMTPGQTFVYTTDSLATSGAIIRKHILSTDVVGTQQPIDGQNCYPFAGTTYDSLAHTNTPELYYVRYDAGKFYQYGVRKLIDPTQPNTWDLVGDFTVSRGTTYQIANVSITYAVPGFGSVPFSGPLTGKIADSTVIRTTSNGENIYCYRVELNANIAGTISGVTISGSIFIDYYIGYTDSSHPTNPAGLVELKLRPFNFTAPGGLSIPETGYDRKLYSHNP